MVVGAAVYLGRALATYLLGLYWSVFSPGIVLIRNRSLALVKAEAERRNLERYLDGCARVAEPVDCGAAALQPMEAV